MIRFLFLLILLIFPSIALAQFIGDGVTMQQRNSANTSWVQRYPPNTSPGVHGVYFMNGTGRAISWAGLGSGFTYDAINNEITVSGSTQVQTDWNATSGIGEILNKPTLAAVATSGEYADLANSPLLASVALSGDYVDLTGTPLLASVATSGDYGDLVGTPAFSAVATSGDYDDLSGRPSLADVATSGDYADLTGRPTLAAVATSGAYADLSGKPSLFDGTWASLSGKPSTFAPSAHTHAAADIVSGTLDDARIPSLAISKTTGLQSALDGKFDDPTGTTGQYLRGDGSLATLPSYAISFSAASSRSISLATAYQCSVTTAPCVITVTLQSQSSISLSGASNNEGQITVGSTSGVSSGTGTNVATYKNNLGGGLVVGLSLNSQQANTYTVFIPAGYYFAIRQTSGSGLQVLSAFEQVVDL